MRLEFLHEPDLEFGNGGTHVDVRFGLMQYGPLDVGTSAAPSQLRVGIVGTQATIEQVERWLDRGRSSIAGKESRLTNLFPAFPGFSAESPFRASVVLHDRWRAEIHRREIDGLLSTPHADELVGNAVDLFLQAAQDVLEQSGPMVLICAPPSELLDAVDAHISLRPDPLEEELDESGDTPADRKRVSRAPFHDLLKARGMRLNIPIQMVRPGTYTGQQAKKPAKTKRREAERRLQDEATRAWNFHTALYYKAGGIPWRIIRVASELTACFIGISFYRSLDGDRLLTSIAQVFNERGEGLIVKGGPAKLDKDDRTPHLSADDAASLIAGAIRAYRREHKTSPARLVIHKTSRINAEELAGFRAAADEERVEIVEAISVRRSLTRLFREGVYPPLRGTFLDLGATTGLLYLRGSVNFFETYPGMYVPRPLEFEIALSDSTTRRIAEEMLSLSKLNWNNTQFDGGEPITVRAARRVGDILKCLSEDEQLPQAGFRFFM